MKALRRMDREDLLISKFCVESVYGRFLVYSFFQIVNGYALFSRTHLCRKLQRLIFLRGFPDLWHSGKNLTLTTIGRAGSFRMIKDINDVVECEKIHSQ